MKKTRPQAAVILLCLLLVGCSGKKTGTGAAGSSAEPTKQSTIPFAEGQSYAVAYLGYQEADTLPDYAAKYLDTDTPPIHYISNGEYYLVIPRDSGMRLQLYRNEMETMESVLIYEEANAQPFVVQCNVSDIFADVTIRLSNQDETTEFSPFVSLKDGTVEVGTKGLNLTEGQAQKN